LFRNRGRRGRTRRGDRGRRCRGLFAGSRKEPGRGRNDRDDGRHGSDRPCPRFRSLDRAGVGPHSDAADRGRGHRRLAGVEIAFEISQIGGQLVGVLVTVGRILLQQLAHDAIRLGRQVTDELRRRGRLAGQRRAERLDVAGPGEGQPAGDHLVQQHAEREQIAAVIQRLAARLLGRHVGHGPDHLAFPGQLAADRLEPGVHVLDRLLLRPRAVEQLGQAEVQQLDVAVAGDDDVGRLEIAVHDAVLVGVGQTLGDRNAQTWPLLELQRPTADDLAQGAALEQLHRNEWRAVVLADFVDHGDVGVVQRRGCLGLALKAQPALGIRGQRGRQQLQRDVAVELGVQRFPHQSHAALADALDEAVVSQHLSRFECQFGRPSISNRRSDRN